MSPAFKNANALFRIWSIRILERKKKKEVTQFYGSVPDWLLACVTRKVNQSYF